MRVYFTVDTETSLGGAWSNANYAPLPLSRTVFGEYRSRCYGLPLIMDILESYGFRATFFTEVFCAPFVGDEHLARVFEMIRARGHDAQLHLHPAFRFYADFLNGMPRREVDLMWRLPPEEQCRLIEEGVALFRQFNGAPPRAYRAGCFGASEATLTALHANGIEIDSSYNLAYLGSTCGFDPRLHLNGPASINGLLEFPVTVFRSPGRFGYKPLEISAVSVAETLAAVHCLRLSGCRDAVLVLHSFSLLKNLGVRYERYTPDHIVIGRLRKLCAALKEMREEVEPVVFGDVDLRAVPTNNLHTIPSIGWLRPALRKAVQAYNRLPWI